MSGNQDIVITLKKINDKLEDIESILINPVSGHKIMIEFNYNPDGTIDKITITNKNTGETKVKQFTYDANGNIIRIEDM